MKNCHHNWDFHQLCFAKQKVSPILFLSIFHFEKFSISKSTVTKHWCGNGQKVWQNRMLNPAAQIIDVHQWSIVNIAYGDKISMNESTFYGFPLTTWYILTDYIVLIFSCFVFRISIDRSKAINFRISKSKPLFPSSQIECCCSSFFIKIEKWKNEIFHQRRPSRFKNWKKTDDNKSQTIELLLTNMHDSFT